VLGRAWTCVVGKRWRIEFDRTLIQQRISVAKSVDSAQSPSVLHVDDVTCALEGRRLGYSDG
jgi:hypothetical protein